MNFQNISYFLQVAEKRSFSQAAEALYITQQTLSASIAALEKELGCPLFVRHVPLELTYGGELFLKYAKVFQKNREMMERDFAEIGSGARGRLRVGVTINRGRILMPAVVHAFHETWPKIEAEILEESNDRLIEALYEDEIDLAVANFPEKTHGIVQEDFFQEEVVLAVSRSLLQAGPGGDGEKAAALSGEAPDLSLLQTLPLLLSSARSASGRIARELIRRAGIRPEIKAASGNMETLIEMCILGEGACFCPKSLLADLLPKDRADSMAVLHFPDPETQYPVRFGWLQEEKEWSVRRAFIDTAKRVGAGRSSERSRKM